MALAFAFDGGGRVFGRDLEGTTGDVIFGETVGAITGNSFGGVLGPAAPDGLFSTLTGGSKGTGAKPALHESGSTDREDSQQKE